MLQRGPKGINSMQNLPVNLHEFGIATVIWGGKIVRRVKTMCSLAGSACSKELRGKRELRTACRTFTALPDNVWMLGNAV